VEHLADGGVAHEQIIEDQAQPTPAKSPTPAASEGHRSVMRPYSQASYRR
jgi:hypothetical protein